MANVKFVLDADEAKAVRGFLRVVDSQKKAERQFKKTTGQVGKQNQVTSRMTKNLSQSAISLATNWLSVGAAIGTATALVGKMNQASEQGLLRVKGAQMELGSLSQLAFQDPEQMKALYAAAQETSTQVGMPLAMATKMQFSLSSLGAESAREMIADLYRTVEDPAAVAEAAVTLQTAFGQGEAGSIQQIINKAMAASGVSKTTLNEMLISTASTAPGLRQIGASDEESLAAVAVLSKARRSSDIASTEIQALTAVMMRKGLGGDGLLGGMASIAQETAGMNDEQMISFFGRQEGFKGYQTLMANLEEVIAAANSVNSGNYVGEDDNLHMAIAARRSVPQLAALEDMEISEQKLDLSRENRYGIQEMQTQTSINNSLANATNEGDSSISIAAREIAMALVKNLRGGEFVEVAGDVGGALVGEAGPLAGRNATAGVKAVELLQELVNAVKGNPQAINQNNQTE